MSLASGDLTTYANAQAYVAGFSGLVPASPLISGLVTRISRTLLGKLNRSILVPHTATQQFNGSGTTSLVLPSYPVIGNTITLTISGVSINLAPQANDPLATFNVPFGYRFHPWGGAPPGEPAVVELVGGAWYGFGNQNVVATYRAGYQVTAELVPTTAGTTYTPLTPYGIWATDQGVNYVANGMALVATTGSSPAVGHYVPPSPDAATPVLNYVFNAADVTAGLAVSYGYVPADLEQACLELIGDRASYRSRPGVRSQSLASQESMSYDLSGLSDFVRDVINTYRSVLPPPIGANV